ncbi:winged helix-turn-helix domain-containing protein [Nonomuraea sp. NPDC049695]|uniref:winged helix-turn-helix domain-containing protein n=1 Tax=Nonomuraea sp. NPDC049695 TaxID=3154734 RepID=UPI0034377B85
MSRVLLIEDDPAVREGLESALSRHGHRVRAVESGEQGLDRLRADDYVVKPVQPRVLELSGTPGRVYSRRQLLESVWEHGYFGDSRLVDACVQRWRAKIEDDSAAPVYVQTVRGFGPV